ncbi:hypothetical protein BYT27DRAFT_7221451 [Phlegmacium glaucopus]|nr:hypothetical protein BYT27DRAFT_7221451 [Phlegmacium glaucopus]
MDGLDDDQRRAVRQLQEISNTTDDDVAVGVLSSKATELIFGSASIPSSSKISEVQTFDIDDSHQGELGEVPRRRPRSLLSLLTFPFHIISSIFRFVFGFLRIPIPQLRFMTLNFYRTRHFRPPSRGGPDRWLRELEEETGAISIGRLKVPRGTTSSLNTELGQSSLTSRRQNGQTEDGRKLLPDFTLSTYEEMLRLCQREIKIGCVILVSEEHDDVPEFKRSTLTDPAFVKALSDNDIIVWGGDVRDQEAWSAAERLQATSYPFVAFVALQPRRSLASSSSSSRDASPPSLTVLSRHQGKCIPSSGPTSAQTLVDHIERQLLPRVTPFLNRLISSNREREHDRHLRDEQDRAFQMTAQRDKERIEAKMAAEQAAIEAKRLAEEETRLASQRRAREVEIARVKENDRMDWRRWSRRAIIFNPVENTAGSLRIAIRLPAGGRVIHQFSHASTLTSLYAFVDSQLIPDHYSASDDPISLPQQRGVGEQALEDHILKLGQGEEYWGFNVVLAYPRMKIPWKAGRKLSDIEQLKGGGQVVVEFNTGRPRDSERSNTDEDDGYHTEDSE